MQRLFLAAAVAVAGLCACTSTPPPPRQNNGVALATDVRRIRPRRGFLGRTTTVYFVRLPEGHEGQAGGDEGSLAGASSVISSNFVRGTVCYLLNAEPGTYAAVAAKETKDGKQRTYYFPLALIEKTMVTVSPGKAAWMGRAAVNAQPSSLNQDAAQKHYRRLIGPDWRRMRPAERVFMRKNYLTGTVFTFEREEAVVPAAVEELFTEAGWR